MTAKTWIVYKTHSAAATGWEERMLQPSGQGTDILWENWDYSGHLPQVGDRTRFYASCDEDRGGITHGKTDSWVIVKVQQFKAEDSDERIMICYCAFSPMKTPWERLKRGQPVHEMTNAELVG